MRTKFRCALVLLAASFVGQSVTLAATRHWIQFRDKGPGTTGALSAPLRDYATRLLSPRALKRRAKVRPADALVDVQDLPLYQPYLDSLASIGIRPVRSLRWFNAITSMLTDSQFESLRAMGFVQAVAPVRTFYRNDPAYTASHASLGKETSLDTRSVLDYGGSYAQIHLSALDSLHALGITGHDVLIGHLDVGVHWEVHEALLNSRVIAEYDFVRGDSVTEDQPNEGPGQDGHGTLTFSDIAGFKPGTFLGGAFNASFLIAKTEDVFSETHIEEDNYAAALEWMEGRGVDITTSSLGYSRFDSGQVSYTIGDMNGHTAICTRALARAVALGVCGITAAGNSGADSTWPYIAAPGDADSAITVGAVDSFGVIANFSGRGPTADGRTKPDVCAMGVATLSAVRENPTGYVRAAGTSLSTPIIASCAALLLSAHPELTPIQVRDALRAAGDHATNPDTAYGWGTSNVYRAAKSLGVVISNPPRVAIDMTSGAPRIVCGVVAEEGIIDSSVRLTYRQYPDTFIAVNLPMKRVGHSNLFSCVLTNLHEWDQFTGLEISASSTTGRHATWRDSDHSSLIGTMRVGDSTVFRLSPIGYGSGDDSVPGSYRHRPESDTLSTFPNPYMTNATIRIGLTGDHNVKVDLYDVLGHNIRRLFEGSESGWHEVEWNTSSLPQGSYFLWMRSIGRGKALRVSKF